MKLFPSALAIAACILCGATGVAADPALNGVAVNGTVAGGNSNAAIGAFALARQAIGVVNGDTKVNGVADNTTVANGNSNLSTGIAPGSRPARFGR
jgi:hypothetical protein